MTKDTKITKPTKLTQLIEEFSNETATAFFRSKISTFSSETDNLQHLINGNEENERFKQFSKLQKIGEATFANDDLLVFTCKFDGELSERSSKKTQFEIAKKVLKDDFKDGAIFIFYDENNCFRFSFIRKNYGDKEQKYSNWKRYTYFVDSQATNKTFKDRIENCDFQSLDGIKEAFSVEKLNKDFYNAINKSFIELLGGVLKLPLSDSQEREQTKSEFAVRLIGRTIFCWFLKNKKSSQGKPLIPQEWLSSKKVEEQEQKKNNYYHAILEKLFFLLLNQKFDERKDFFDLPQGHETVPFLNGGLFEAQPNDFFKEKIANHSLDIPNTWFLTFFETLEQYNFTIDENSSHDTEISIDPEMLGTIFENLLAEINPETKESARKSTGSFYTPRAIVDYMVEQSLLQYIKNHTNIDNENNLRQLLLENIEQNTVNALFDESQKTAILESLSNLKILDPACGSGAFPMGILQKILTLLKNLDADASWWKKKQLSKIENILLRQEMDKKLSTSNVDYIRKIGIIQNSIYGVDIQPIATEISKLRIFLSLIIDENIDDTADNRGIIPLPNLEFKFVTANGLIELKQKQIEQATFLCDQTESLQQDLESVRIEFLQATSQKQELKIRFEQLQKEILEKELDDDGFNGGGAINERADQLISWKPFSNKCCDWFDPKWMFGVEGFDIVIGNPPYVQLQKNKSEFGKLYKDKGFETFEGSGDIYVLFYEKSFHLLNQNGISCFITSNKWLRAGYGEKLRRFLLTKTQLIALFDLGADVFESATVDSNILIFGSSQNQPQFSNLEISSLKNTKAKDTDLYEYWEKQKIEINPAEKYDATGKQGWFIGCPAEFSLKRKIEEKGKPLKDWDIKINRGILTGFNEAFIIDTETKERLCIEDPKSIEILKPILRGKDINRYGYEWKGLWVINSHNGVKSKKVSRIDVEKDYPAIYNHLQQFENQLIKREDQGDHWSNLRNCAYIEEFEKEKVVWTPVNSEYKFTILPSGYFMNNSLFMITGGASKLFCSILNSKIIRKYLEYLFGSEDNYEYGSKEIVETIPIPLIDTPQKQNTAQKIEELVDGILKNKEQKVETKDLEQQIDELVYQLYELTDDEIKVVNNEL